MLENAKPIRFRPRSLTNTLNGGTSPPGSMASLQNLICDPATLGAVQCRPGAVVKTSFSSFSTPTAVSVFYVLGTLVFGLIGSALTSGKDQPFCYNILTNTFLTVNGITSTNVPTTQATTGDWTPPTMDMIGQQLVVTHPGFAGASTGYYFGLFDISGFTETAPANTNTSTTLTGNFPLAGVSVGMTISGTGIPTGTTVVNKNNVNLTYTGTLNGTTTVSSMSSTTGLAVGQAVTGVDIATGTTIAAVGSGSITLSQAATGSATGSTLYFTGTTITMSAAATASSSNVSVTIAGGTPSAPLWGAGNVTENPLFYVPTFVRQFYTRAYFGVGNTLVYTDTLALNCTLATQAITVGDTTPLTAAAPLQIATYTQGQIQGLIVFKANYIIQVTGDAALSTLAQVTISPEGIGTSSPRSLAVSPTALYFIAPDGLRRVTQAGTVTDPDLDVITPFQNILYKSRASAAFNTGIYRVCLQRSDLSSEPWQEFWFDETRRFWTGPHTFTQDMIVPYANSFIASYVGNPATLYQSDVLQNGLSSITEYGAPLNWIWATSSIGDGDEIYAGSMINSTLDIAYEGGPFVFNATVLDESGANLATAVMSLGGQSTLWGDFLWGGAPWGGASSGLKPYQMPWNNGATFNKPQFSISGQSVLGLKIGLLKIAYQPLNYLLQ